jgi:RHH-type rel operon transcriptional repressor/antitoxin RelB
MTQTTVEADEMADRATVTFHTATENKSRPERLAKATRRSKSYLSNEALERYLETEEGFVDAVLQGIEQADAGNVHTSSEIKEHLRRSIDVIASKHKSA